MKIKSFQLLNEANDALLNYISNLDDITGNLSKNTGIKAQNYSDVSREDLSYEYNINNLKLRFTSDYNDITTTRGEYSYAFYNNTLHILGSSRRGDELIIEIDTKIPLTELKKGIKYKIKSLSGKFQSISGRESFEFFEIMEPQIIRLSKKKETEEGEEKNKTTKLFQFKPNAVIDLNITNLKGGKLINLKGEARIEATSTKSYQYKITTSGSIYTITLDKQLNNKPDMQYNIKMATKVTPDKSTSTVKDLLLVTKSIKFL